MGIDVSIGLTSVIFSNEYEACKWPLSRWRLHTHILAILSVTTSCEEPSLRAGGVPECDTPIIFCDDEQRLLAAKQLCEIDDWPYCTLLESLEAGRTSLVKGRPNAIVAATRESSEAPARRFGRRLRDSWERNDNAYLDPIPIDDG